MTDEQVREVRALTRAAGINPTTTKLDRASHAVLQVLKPGVRTTPGGLVATVTAQSGGHRGPRNGGGGRGGNAGGGGGGNARRGGQRRGRSGGSRTPTGGGRSGNAPARASSGRPHSAASFSSKAR